VHIITLEKIECMSMKTSGHFFSGAAFGAVSALLLAPRAGRKTREELRRYALRAEHHLLQLLYELDCFYSGCGVIKPDYRSGSLYEDEELRDRCSHLQ